MTETIDRTAAYLGFLITQGYEDVRLIGGGRWAALFPFLFTSAIIIGRLGDMAGYDDRWCYESQSSATAALDDWAAKSFQGEPDGWHRHPGTGRRRDGEKEWVNW